MENKIIRPVFTLELNYKIVPGLVTVGKYDGTHVCLTAVTTADKVLIHSPHRRNPSTAGRLIWSEMNREIATLNINQTITALAAGNFVPDEEKDILIIGTATHVLAYHVHDNKDVFYKEFADGVKSLVLGNFKDFQSPILLVGGNSSIHGVNHLGDEIFWTAIGDIVTAMILMPYTNDIYSNELIVSSEDFKIRTFKGDQILNETVETEVVTGLCSLPNTQYAYSVSNGTLGVYQQDNRLWRVKSKNFVISMHPYDLFGQSAPQLITGWSNGKIDCRSLKNGDVLFKDTMNAGVAGVVEGDYRSIGKNDVICVSVEGEVRGYTTTKTLVSNEHSGVQQDLVRELLTQKQTLLMELKHYENNTQYNENIDDQYESFENTGVIPANTRLQIAVSTSEKLEKPQIELYIASNNSTTVRAVIIFAEGIFDGESHVVHPPMSKLTPDLAIPLYLPKDHVVDLHIKVLVGFPNSIQYHVFEVTRQLPQFSMYLLNNDNSFAEKSLPTNSSFVEFKLNERLQRICMWLNQYFLLANDIELNSNLPNLTVSFTCLRDQSKLVMVFEMSGRTKIFTENLCLAADLVQSLGGYLKLDSLESQASFPREEDTLKALMYKLNEIQEARIRLGADVADRLSQIRGLVLKAEDNRINDIKELGNSYTELYNINKELINGCNVRLKNYEEGVDAMRIINGIIQKASRLRVGPKAASMLQHCRTTVKNNNVEGLVKVLQSGGV